MKIMRFAIAVGLLAGLGACSDMMGNRGSSSSSQSTAMAAPPAVAPDMVRKVQSKLRDDGYYKQGAVDGMWGSATQASVRSFQQDHNLTANGQLDVPTLQALNIASGSASDTSYNAAANNGASNNGSMNNGTAPTQPNYNPPPANPNMSQPGTAPQH